VRAIVGIIMMASATPPPAGEVFLAHHDQPVGDNADHDRRHAVQHIGDKADEIAIAVASVFREEDAGANAEGQPSRLAMPRMTIEPAMALAMPPPGSPTALGLGEESEIDEPMPL